jgi:hypothetical protein
MVRVIGWAVEVVELAHKVEVHHRLQPDLAAQVLQSHGCQSLRIPTLELAKTLIPRFISLAAAVVEPIAIPSQQEVLALVVEALDQTQLQQEAMDWQIPVAAAAVPGSQVEEGQKVVMAEVVSLSFAIAFHRLLALQLLLSPKIFRQVLMQRQ